VTGRERDSAKHLEQPIHEGADGHELSGPRNGLEPLALTWPVFAGGALLLSSGFWHATFGYARAVPATRASLHPDSTPSNFIVAGWASVLSALGLIPVVALTVAISFFPENRILQILNDGLSLVTAGLGIYVLMSLKRLLHVHAFQALDFILALLIGGIVTGAVVELVGTLVVAPELAAGVQLTFAMVMGLISGVLGFKILPAAEVLPGPVKPFAYLTMLSGVCLVTIILLPVGVLASMAGDIALALMFFRASEAPVVH